MRTPYRPMQDDNVNPMAITKKTPAKASVTVLRKVPAKAVADSKKPAKKSKKAVVLSSKLAFKGRIFNVFTDKVQEPNGTVNTRQVIRHNGSIVILAVDASTNARDPDVILIRQYRHAAGQFLLELPAGRIEPGEKPLATAKREMIEETGFRAKKWTLLTRLLRQPRISG